MTKFYHSLFILAIFVLNSCDEPGVVGLEVQPSSDKIEIFSNNFNPVSYTHLTLPTKA